MIIAVSGRAGAGKSTLAKALAKELRLKRYSSGDLQRQIAKEKGLSLLDLNILEEKSDELDKLVDQKTAELGVKEDNFVIDGRLTFHFIPKATLKVFLTADIEERARRIFGDKREGDSYKSMLETVKSIRKREASEKLRYKKYYGLDYTNPRNFDLIIDTTSAAPDSTVKQVLAALKRRK